MTASRNQLETPRDPEALQEPLTAEMLAAILNGGKPVLKGQRIANYRLVAEVARRGGCVVVRAVDEKLGGEVALKLLNPRHTNEQLERQLFTEAAVLARLSGCAGVVRFRAAGRSRGIAYLATRWVEALPLGAWLQRERPSMDQRVAVLVGLARSLEAMHDVGVAHLDMSPSNVLICRKTRRPIICDLGAAEVVGSDGSVCRLGNRDRFIPRRSISPGYSAPELFVADAFGQPGIWSDVYSLGGLAFLMATGELPAQGGNSRELIRNTLATKAPDPSLIDPAIPHRLASLCRRCLRRRSHKRPRSMAAVAAMLTSMLEAVPVAGDGQEPGKLAPWRNADRVTAEYSCPLLEPASPGPGPSRVVAAAAMVLLAGVGSLAGLWVGSIADETSQSAPATFSRAEPIGTHFGAATPGALSRPADHTGRSIRNAETR